MYDEDFLTDDEIERVIDEQLQEHGSVSESDTSLIVKEMNGSILSAHIVDAWRRGYMRTFVREGHVVYALTEFGAQTFDRMRNEDR